MHLTMAGLADRSLMHFQGINCQADRGVQWASPPAGLDDLRVPLRYRQLIILRAEPALYG